jgi:hypothetical protein
LKARGAHSSISLSGRRRPDRTDDAPTAAAAEVCHPQFHNRATAFRAHVRRPCSRLFHLRAQRRRLPFLVLLFVLPIALPYPLSTTTWTGRSNLPPRPHSLQQPPPKLIVAPRPPSRRPSLLLRPAVGGVLPPTHAAVDGPYLMSSSIRRFSLRFTVAASPFHPLTLLPCSGAPKGARSRHHASALPTPTPLTGESLTPCTVF